VPALIRPFQVVDGASQMGSERVSDGHKSSLFTFLRTLDSAALLELLEKTYECMNRSQFTVDVKG
jgi:hypothetical protein